MVKFKNVLSLFDGISCAQLALQRAGIEYDNYFASEIDPHAIAVTQHHFPDTVQLGDIREIFGMGLPEIDLVLAGFSCQSFSVAGKRDNFNDPRGQLFFELVRLLDECKPKYFLAENVNMKKEWREKIDGHLKSKGVTINSALLSAQQRRRTYWTDIPIKGLPEDRGYCVNDILDTDTTDCYFLDPNYWMDSRVVQDKHKVGYDSNKPQRIATIDKGGQGQRIYSKFGKSIALCANGGGQGAKTGLYAVPNEGKSFDFIQQDSLLDALHNDECVVRMLTPRECERLQNLPDDYTNIEYNGRKMSKTNRYKMIGNGWTVDVIAWILNEIN